MKNLFVLVLILSLFSCSSSKKTIQIAESKEVKVLKGCPDRATCEIEVLENKSIQYQTEESTGKFFPQLKSDSTKTVVKVVMDLNSAKAAVDGQYREEIMFEWPNFKNEKEIDNEELQNIKMVYGRFCFCPKEQVGYFKINQGNLKVNKEEFSLEFLNTQNIPQLLKEVRVSFK